jgi:hypothetical protein
MPLIYKPFQTVDAVNPQPLEAASAEEAGTEESEAPEELEDIGLAEQNGLAEQDGEGQNGSEGQDARDGIIEEVNGVSYINEETLHTQTEKETGQKFDSDFKNLVDSVLLDD